MFIKKNSPIYWITAIIIVVILFRTSKPKMEDFKQRVPKPLQEVDLNSNDIISSFNQISEAIKESELKQQAIENEVKTRLIVTHTNFPEGGRQVGLCENGYIFDISVFDENGTLLSKNKSINISKFGYEKNFYNVLNRALTLTSIGQKIELSSASLENFPKSLLGKKTETEGLYIIAMLTVQSISGKANFNPESISSFIAFNSEKSKKRPSFPYFCKEEVEVKYSLYDSKGKIVEENVKEKVILGKGKTEKDYALEYLVLTSKDDKIDAIVRTKDFLKNQPSETLIIKGTITKKDV